MLFRVSILCYLLVFFTCKNCNNSAVVKTEESSWVSLFDGSSLEGWRAYNGENLPPGWAIIDSVMTFSTEIILEKDYDYKGSRDIIYGAQEFENFELYLEWKIPPGGNSGIFYHVVEGYSGIPEIAHEYQLIDDHNYTDFHDITDYNRSIGVDKNPHLLQPFQSTAADYAMYSPNPLKKKLNPPGYWNSSKIIFTSNRVEHYLNGERVLEFAPWSSEWENKLKTGKWGFADDYGRSKVGYIGLQDHGSPLWFRNIKIKPLP